MPALLLVCLITLVASAGTYLFAEWLAKLIVRTAAVERDRTQYDWHLRDDDR